MSFRHPSRLRVGVVKVHKVAVGKVSFYSMKMISVISLGLMVGMSAGAQNLETPAPRPNPPLPYTAKVDPAIPAYKPVKGLSGTLKGVESNTVTVLEDKWIEGFTPIYPNG